MNDRDLPRPAGDVVEDGVPATEEVRDEFLATGDAGVGDMPMPDRPWAVDEWGTTAGEEEDGEPLDLRLARELPDTAATGDAGARFLEPGADEGWPDVEDDTIGEADTGRTDSLSAEEAAMSIRDDDESLGLSYDDSPGYLD